MTIVLDASAILAFAYGEPGADTVADLLPGSTISAVNAAEVVSKLVERGTPPDELDAVWSLVSGLTSAFTAAHAWKSGLLRDATRSAGLSLGDRACLALAQDLDARVVTADRAWTALDLGIEVEVIR